MNSRNNGQITFNKDFEIFPFSYGSIIFNKKKFIEVLSEIKSQTDLVSLKNKILVIFEIIKYPKNDKKGLLNIDQNGDTISLNREILSSEINQILEAKTLERAKYYLKRLENGIKKIKTNKINEINLYRWKEYREIITDSLWVLDKRDTSGAHLGWYWGNFIPQIPNQLILRYTKKEDWILDAFVGSGTTLIECRRLGRNGIGIELNYEIVEKAKYLVNKEYNKYKITTEITKGDSRIFDLSSLLNKYGINQVQLIIMHPPYHDIIKFSKENEDLSNAKNTNDFLKMFGEVIDNITPFLEKGRYFALVIGDKYNKGEWIPLGFYCMNEVLKRNFMLKSTIVKNFDETRAKRDQKELWRYRALAGGFYVFKHEYIFIFKKK